MKIFKTLSISAFVFITLGACENSQTTETTEVIEILEENLVVADYTVDGMMCAMGCAATIQEEVKGMSGVADCEVDFESGKAHISYDKSQLEEKDIIAKIQSLADGKYKVSPWQEKTEPLESTELEEVESDNETVSEVSFPEFEFPNLFTLLLDQL